ncbi:MAG TPA: CHASE domain-containing protein, partial [Rhodocyclaceae bacterium]|nr:CHASE domain-containing protein [Rhodocyclaceae bacterium]
MLRKGRHQGWIPWAVLVVGLGLTGTTATLSKHSLREASEARFEQRSNEIHTALQARLLAFVQSLRDVQAYVGAIGTVTPANWHHMSETLKLAETYPGFEGLIYVRTTNGDQLPALLAEERRRGEKDLSLKPPGQRDFHAVITAIEPHTPNNLQALGYDGWNEPRRRAAMERARDTGTPQITGKIQLHIDRHKSPTPAFLIYQPLYRDGKLPATVEERRAQLVGFAGNGIRYQDLMRSLLPEGLRDVDIHIYDNPTTEPNAQPDEKDLAYDSLSSFMLPAEPLRRTERLTLGGRPWVLVYQATDRFVSPVEASYPQRLLVVGTLISLLLFALSKTLVHQRLRAEQLAGRMTQSLRKSESKLRALVAQAPLGIWVLDRNGVVLECNDKIASYATAPIEKIVGLNMLTEARDKVLGNALQQAVDGTPSSLETTYTSTAGGHTGYYHFHFQPVYVEGELDQIVGFVEDINARKRAEEKLAYLAHHDTLTGLANRTVLKQELHAAIADAEGKMRAGQPAHQVAVLFLDLDRFNTVNDSLGHTIGDALLVKLAHRLVMAAGTNNLLTRIGGDEFVVLLRDIQGPEDCIPVASRLLAAAAQPMA